MSDGPRRPTVRGDAAAVGLFYAALFLGVGINVPYLPVFLAGRGLAPDEIALVLAAPLVARALVLPVLGTIADRIGSLTRAILLYAAITFALVWSIWFADGFLALLVTTAAVSVFWTAQTPLADAVAMRLARTSGASYGRMRACGSVAFVVTASAAGLVIGAAGSEAIFWMFAVGISAALVAAAVLALRRMEAPPPVTRPSWSGALSAIRPALPVVAACALVQSSHAMFYGFGSIGWERQGFSSGSIGVLWAVGVVAEIVLFLVPARHLGRLPAPALALFGALAAVVRWSWQSTEPGYAVTFALQALHGLTFGATYLAMVRHVAETAEAGRQGGAQALAATMVVLCMAAATVVTGPLYAAFGQHAFLAMAAPAAVGLAIIVTGAVRRAR